VCDLFSQRVVNLVDSRFNSWLFSDDGRDQNGGFSMGIGDIDRSNELDALQ
jgi:hypothetical protein